MKRLKLVALLLTVIFSFAGMWTSHNYLYKPSQGEYGTISKQNFDLGFDRVDTRLAMEVYVGDPNYPTLASAIGTLNLTGTPVTLIVPTGIHTITTDLTSNSNINLQFRNGAIVTVPATKTFTINGTLDAGPYQIFAGTGTVAYGSLVYIKYSEWSGGTGINVVLTTGNQTVAGVKTFSSFPITPSSAPTTDYQTANKKYVDDNAVVSPSFALLQNRRAQNTPGGTGTTGSWQIIPLNTEQEDTNNIVDSTSLPAFSLGAGTYRIEAISPFNWTSLSQTRLYNVTDAAVEIIGESVNSPNQYNSINSMLIGTITIASTKQLRLEYRISGTVGTSDLGVPCNFGVEVYAQVLITKIQ